MRISDWGADVCSSDLATVAGARCDEPAETDGSAEGESPPTAHAQPARFDVFVHAAVPPLCGLLSQWWTGDLVRNWLSAVNLLGEHLNARSGPPIDLSAGVDDASFYQHEPAPGKNPGGHGAQNRRT